MYCYYYRGLFNPYHGPCVISVSLIKSRSFHQDTWIFNSERMPGCVVLRSRLMVMRFYFNNIKLPEDYLSGWLLKNVQHASSDFIKERPKYGHKQRNWSKAKVHIKFLATVATTSFTGTESCLLPLLQIEESFSICIVRGWHCREQWMVQCSMLQNMGVSRLSLTLTFSRYNQNRIQNDQNDTPPPPYYCKV